MALLTFSVCAQAEQLTLTEFGITFEAPDNLEWVTCTEGNFDVVGSAYSKSRDQMIEYMKAIGEYFNAVEPDGDLRITVMVLPANGSYGNYDLCTDGELQNKAVDLGGTVLKTEQTGFICVMTDPLGQTLLSCLTCMYGNFIIVNVRGAEEENVQAAAVDFLNTMSFVEIGDIYNMTPVTMPVSGAVIPIPGGWTENTHTVNDSAAQLTYTGRSFDGILRMFVYSESDVCTLSGNDDSMRPYLASDYTEYMTKTVAGNDGVSSDEVIEYVYNGRSYYGYEYQGDDYLGLCVYLMNNGYLHMFSFMVDTDNITEDPFMPVFELILSNASF